MKPLYWHPLQRRLLPPKLRPWIAEKGSLTQRLRRYQQTAFSVEVLGHYWAKPLQNEALKLQIGLHEMAYQREVILRDGAEATIYARTIVPRQTYQQVGHYFRRLGNQALGDVLFRDPHVRRSRIEVAKIRPYQWLYPLAMFEQEALIPTIWARRSLFYFGQRPILVNELFLPAIERL